MTECPNVWKSSSALAEESLGVIMVPWGGDAVLKASGPSSCLHGAWQVLSDKFQFKKNHELQEALLKESLYLMLHNGAP